MASIKLDTQDLAALKGHTAHKVFTKCAQDVKHWKLPHNLSPEARAACEQMARDIHHCFTGYAATIGSSTPALSPMLEKFSESTGKL